MRRLVSSILVLSLLSMYYAPAVIAQEIGGSNKEERAKAEAKAEEGAAVILADDLDGSWMWCHMKGKQDGQKQATGGSTAGGLIGGLLLGFIGTGIAVLAQSPSDPSAINFMEIQEQGDQCAYVYTEAFRQASVSKKRSAALLGGVVGTIIIVTVILLSYSND